VPEGAATDEVLRLAAALDQMSNHVMATAVVQAAHERGLGKLPLPTAVNEVAGAGLSGELAGRRVVLGSLAYVSSQLPSLSPWAQSLQARLDMEGASVVYVACDGVLLGALELADRLRLETPRALRMLNAAASAISPCCPVTGRTWPRPLATALAWTRCLPVCNRKTSWLTSIRPERAGSP
jgi:cation transport ATPase